VKTSAHLTPKKALDEIKRILRHEEHCEVQRLAAILQSQKIEAQRLLTQYDMQLPHDVADFLETI
jgi:hypothetical protein